MTMKKTNPIRRLSALLVVALCAMALSLVACGSGSDAGSGSGSGAGDDATQVEATSTKPFTGREARAATDLDDIVPKAIDVAAERRQLSDSVTEEESERAESAQKDFAAANELYRAGKYAEAQAAYQKLIEADPLSLGANVNLTLALLQQQKNDEAMVQALACLYLFHDDQNTLLNVQATGEACGFAAEDVVNAARTVLGSEGTTELPELLDRDQTTKAYWDYNIVWSDIETQLNGTPEESTYKGLWAELDRVAQTVYDEDLGYLGAYLEAVGNSLGFDTSATSSATAPTDGETV